jgi:hypothetical protein
MSAERIWANSAAAGLLLLAALLIFANLNDRRLWDDEAETALLAKSILRFGVPVAWDSVTLISQECSTDYDSNYLWRQTQGHAFSYMVIFGRSPFTRVGVVDIPRQQETVYRWGDAAAGYAPRSDVWLMVFERTRPQ